LFVCVMLLKLSFMIGLKLSLPYWLRRVHIADNIRKPSEVLRKTINTSLRENISESKFKETKSKFKRPQHCQNLLIPTVNEVVWTKKCLRSSFEGHHRTVSQ
jgi:hypothetical protein